VTDDIALSPFDHSESLLVHAGALENERGLFKTAALWEGNLTRCSITDVLQQSLAPSGHNREILQDIHREAWVMSCCRGQAVYPKISESEAIAQPGCLILSWASGLLRHYDENFSRVCGSWHEGTRGKELSMPVPSSQNLSPEYNIIWQVSPEDGFLSARLAFVLPKDEKPSSLASSPFRILRGVSKSLFLVDCSHDENHIPKGSDSFCTYIGLLDLHNFSNVRQY